MTPEYTVGSIVEYAAFGGGLRIVRITSRHSNIKNGRAGFDAEYLDGKDYDVWGYDSQITRVLQNPEVSR